MAATYGKATPETFTPSTTGLILNVNVSNTSSYTGTGTNLADLSGNGNNMTIVGSPTYTAPTVSTRSKNKVNEWSGILTATSQSSGKKKKK